MAIIDSGFWINVIGANPLQLDQHRRPVTRAGRETQRHRPCQAQQSSRFGSSIDAQQSVGREGYRANDREWQMGKN